MGAEVILGLMGGLGLFLYGMKQMSDGLEKAAGARMRSVLEFFTANRLAGTLVGILFTAIIQSSSATTVMVVSFVNSGLMNLMQAAGVIMKGHRVVQGIQFPGHHFPGIQNGLLLADVIPARQPFEIIYGYQPAAGKGSDILVHIRRHGDIDKKTFSAIRQITGCLSCRQSIVRAFRCGDDHIRLLQIIITFPVLHHGKRSFSTPRYRMISFGGEHLDVSVIQQIFKDNTSHFSASADEKYPQQTVRPLVFHAWQPFFRPPRPVLRLKYPLETRVAMETEALEISVSVLIFLAHANAPWNAVFSSYPGFPSLQENK